MRNWFTFGDIISTDYGVYISGTGVYDAPARTFETVSIPGRSGDLILGADRLENIELTYPAFVYTDFKQSIRNLKSALLAKTGYLRLSDTYYPDEFRLAYFPGPVTVDPAAWHDAGEFDLTFICKPQRWLKSGEETIEFTASGGNITNPTPFPSKPLIRVTGYGELYIGSQRIAISSGFTYIDIDSDVMECYNGTQSAGTKVVFGSADFPELPAGKTGITWSGNISKVAITPRWWWL